ncbi:heavy metal-associated isoprenylated plant protein 16-like [Aristolochia californica]|uniref:heavy metal-associated isoprenylated plant protein 16-like n=1 Tax=Aristolochia californica TaxID=171875 RepID=UPI0035E037A7
MMKKKMVIRVYMNDHKTRCKALKIAVSQQGVSSAGVEGADRDQIVLIGEGVDPVDLTRLLRKRLGCAELISVADAEEKKEKKSSITYSEPIYWSVPPQYVYEVPARYNEPCLCSIM